MRTIIGCYSEHQIKSIEKDNYNKEYLEKRVYYKKIDGKELDSFTKKHPHRVVKNFLDEIFYFKKDFLVIVKEDKIILFTKEFYNVKFLYIYIFLEKGKIDSIYYKDDEDSFIEEALYKAIEKTSRSKPRIMPIIPYVRDIFIFAIMFALFVYFGNVIF